MDYGGSSASGYTCHCATSRFSGNTGLAGSSIGLCSNTSVLIGSLTGGFTSSASAVTGSLTSWARNVSALADSHVG